MTSSHEICDIELSPLWNCSTDSKYSQFHCKLSLRSIVIVKLILLDEFVIVLL